MEWRRDAEQKSRSVYLLKDEIWIEYFTGKEYNGGQKIEADAPLDSDIHKEIRGFTAVTFTKARLSACRP